jgi:cell division septum initiation protein DivIVA
MTSMSFEEFEQLQAEVRKLRQENEQLKTALEEILGLETSEDRWGGHISETGKLAQHALVKAGARTDC